MAAVSDWWKLQELLKSSSIETLCINYCFWAIWQQITTPLLQPLVQVGDGLNIGFMLALYTTTLDAIQLFEVFCRWVKDWSYACLFHNSRFYLGQCLEFKYHARLSFEYVQVLVRCDLVGLKFWLAKIRWIWCILFIAYFNEIIVCFLQLFEWTFKISSFFLKKKNNYAESHLLLSCHFI